MPEALFALDLNNVPAWIDRQRQRLRLLREAEATLTALDVIQQKANRYGIHADSPDRPLPLSEVSTWMQQRICDLEPLVSEAEAKEKRRQDVVNCIAAKARDLSWVPYGDNDLPPETWDVILEDPGSSPLLRGISFRVTTGTGSDACATYIQRLLELSETSLDIKNMRELTLLSPLQVALLYDNDDRLRYWLKLLLLECFYVAGEANERRAMDLWFMRPLVQHTKRTPHEPYPRWPSAVADVISCLYNMADRQNVRSFGSLRKVMLLARSGGCSVRDADRLYEEIKTRMQEPRFGGNYGPLARKAFDELFSPHRMMVAARKVKEFHLAYEQLRASFDFKQAYARWCRELKFRLACTADS